MIYQIQKKIMKSESQVGKFENPGGVSIFQKYLNYRSLSDPIQKVSQAKLNSTQPWHSITKVWFDMKTTLHHHSPTTETQY